ncbi:hypothetical protein [Arthrobacter sp. P2b]|uniref:hypothetical protein n=1 Tax=Arthrobacter sp. P2b TaxID=1938741 RepID=UPI0009A5CA07|nr:hypothetical protein [Arthrobacter sp. P2b]SLK12143.1 hypothetical protein SAMN06272721_11627 [Arthrobacter sp. P2b]
MRKVIVRWWNIIRELLPDIGDYARELGRTIFMVFLKWVESTGIHVVAALAALTLVVTTVIGSNQFGFKIESDDRPILYDLSLAILTAYFFNLLVITIPRHRKQREIYSLVFMDLDEVQRRINDLIIMLHVIARYPVKKNPDHLDFSGVLIRTPNNDTVLATIRYELDAINKALYRIGPYSEALGSDMQVALGRLRDSGLNDLVKNVEPERIRSHQLDAARTPRTQGPTCQSTSETYRPSTCLATCLNFIGFGNQRMSLKGTYTRESTGCHTCTSTGS